jgi:hypothetical protein
MVEANLRYSKDPQLLLDVVSAMPRRVDNTLHNFRNKLLGNVPKHRDEFNPETLLSRMEGGEKILVMDSLKDLPQNWRNLDLKKEYGIEEECIDNQADTQSSGLSDNQQDSDEDPRPGDSGESDSGVEHPEDAEEEGSATGNPQAKAPKRVILFTTIMMLGLLSKCRWGSVDGTFKSSSKQWKQLFVMLCKYEGSWLPMAFGWLPDKSFTSYQIFLILLMEAFRSHSSQIKAIYGRSKLKLKKVKMDFEINIIRAFDVLFIIRGCLFHFSQAGNILKRVKIQK